MCGTSSSAYSSSGRSWSAQTPVALTTFVGLDLELLAAHVVAHSTPAARPSRSTRPVTSQPLAHTAPKRSASPSTVSTSRASSVWQS